LVANIFFQSSGYGKCTGVKSRGINSWGDLFCGFLSFQRYPIYPGLDSKGSLLFGLITFSIIPGSCVLPTTIKEVPPYLLTDFDFCFISLWFIFF